jgi:hypothetical protein
MEVVPSVSFKYSYSLTFVYYGYVEKGTLQFERGIILYNTKNRYMSLLWFT